MPYLQGSDTSATVALTSIPLRGKLQHRFYEPIVLLLALTQACMQNVTSRIPEPLQDAVPRSSSVILQDFINKLCQICDNKHGGSTVTSISVIQYPDRVQYRLASNQRSGNELLTVKTYLEDILGTLRDFTDASSRRVKALILRKIVNFNRPRLLNYVKNLVILTDRCLETPDMSTELSSKLSQLHDLALNANNRDQSEIEFLVECDRLMHFVRDFSQSVVYRSLREKIGSQGSTRSPWAELRHSAGRLVSYFQAARTLLEARKEWEQLFYDIEIKLVRSSTPINNPIIRKSISADDIIGRMTGDASKIKAHREHASHLQRFHLDQNIKDEVTRSSFKPFVHAEVLVYQSIMDDFGLNGLRPSHFFNGYKYIGSSKPTCRLCDYYFAASASGIEVRETHRNLYPNWRVPDVYSNQGKQAEVQREQIVMKVLEKVREDAFRTLCEKIPERKQFDSNTDPTFPTWNPGTSVGFDGGGRDADLDDVAASMHQLDLRGPSGEAPEVRPESSFRASVCDSDADDDEGGARLS